MNNFDYVEFIFTVDEALKIANEVFNIPLSECQLLIREFDIIRATERIYTWLKTSRYTNPCKCNSFMVSGSVIDIVKNAVVLYVISYHKDDTATSDTDKQFELVAYDYLKNRGLISFR